MPQQRMILSTRNAPSLSKITKTVLVCFTPSICQGGPGSFFPASDSNQPMQFQQGPAGQCSKKATGPPVPGESLKELKDELAPLNPAALKYGVVDVLLDEL